MGDIAHHTALLQAARRVLVAPPPDDARDFTPVRQRLRHALPHATLIPLADPPACDPADLLAYVDRLAAARLDAALIFTADGDSPFELAYLAYLAGIPVRAGQSAEFGGGVLAPWIRPPPHGTPPVRRHLALLDALGL